MGRDKMSLDATCIVIVGSVILGDDLVINEQETA